MGLYYNPPFVNVGNQQPLQQPLLDPPQSGPVAQNPPTVGTQVGTAVLVCWAAVVAASAVLPTLPQQLHPPISGPAAPAPPPPTRLPLEIFNQWQVPPPVPPIVARNLNAALIQTVSSPCLAVSLIPIALPDLLTPQLPRFIVPISGPAVAQVFPNRSYTTEVEVSWSVPPPAPIVAQNLTPPSGAAPASVPLPNPIPLAIQIAWIAAPPAPIVANNLNAALFPPQVFVPTGGGLAAAFVDLPAIPFMGLKLIPPISGPAPQNPPIVGSQVRPEILISWQLPAPAPIVTRTTFTQSGPVVVVVPPVVLPESVLVSWQLPATAPILAANLNPPQSAPGASFTPPAVSVPEAVLVAWQAAAPAPIVAKNLVPPQSGPPASNPPPFATIPEAILVSWIPPTLPAITTINSIPTTGPAVPTPLFTARGILETEVSWLPTPLSAILARNLVPPISGPLSPAINGTKIPAAVLVSWLPVYVAPIIAHNLTPPSGPQNPPLIGARVPVEVQVAWAIPAPLIITGPKLTLSASSAQPQPTRQPFIELMSWQVQPSGLITRVPFTPSAPPTSNPPFAGGAKVPLEVLIGWLPPSPMPITGIQPIPSPIIPWAGYSSRVILLAGPSRIIVSKVIPMYREQWPNLNPGEDLDGDINYSIRLAAPPATPGDYITSSTWSQVSGDAVPGSQSFTGQFTKLWVSATGTPGTVSEFLNTVVTFQGRTFTTIAWVWVDDGTGNPPPESEGEIG